MTTPKRSAILAAKLERTIADFAQMSLDMRGASPEEQRDPRRIAELEGCERMLTHLRAELAKANDDEREEG